MAGILSKRVLSASLALVVAAFIGLLLLNSMAGKPDNLGMVDGRLRSCGGWQNCVCSEEGERSNGEAAVQPIPYEGPSAEAIESLVHVISQMPGAKIVSQTDEYLHAEFTSSVFHFTDDVEFRIDEAASVIHFRSASRIGFFDLGANRARMDEVAARFASRV